MRPAEKGGRSAALAEDARAAMRDRALTVDRFREEINERLHEGDRVSLSTVHRWISGGKIPKTEPALAIQEWVQQHTKPTK